MAIKSFLTDDRVPPDFHPIEGGASSWLG